MDKNITRIELIKIITESTAIQDEIAAILEADTKTSISLLSIGSDEAKVYCTDYYLKGSSKNYPLGYAINIRHEYTEASKAFKDINTEWLYQDLSKELQIKLMEPSAYTSYRKKLVEENFKVGAKTLALDEFSYTLFESYIKGLEKPLTGADSLRYIRKIIANSHKDRILSSKYIKLLWTNTKTKSLAMSNFLLTNAYKVDLPFATLSNQVKQATWEDSVHFTLWYFTMQAAKNSIPLNILSSNIKESEMHKYITGIPKSKKMGEYDILYAFDKLKILQHNMDNNKDNCPYYKMAYDQLIEELQDKKNIEVARTYYIKAEKTANAAIAHLKDITKHLKG